MLNESDVVSLVHDILDRELPDDRPVAVLEAGGGSDTLFRLRRQTCVVAFDNNPVQLARNGYAHEKILGDLESAQPISGEYDLVVCWNVLEHLRRPSRALNNMAGCLADDGFLLIGCPELYSLKGLITKLTPHWVHVMYYRHVCGHRRAGEYGYAPFATFLHRDMSLSSIRRRARELGLQVVLSAGYRGSALDSLRRKSTVGHAVYELLAFAMRLGTFYRFEPHRSDYVILFRKCASPKRRVQASVLADRPDLDRQVAVSGI